MLRLGVVKVMFSVVPVILFTRIMGFTCDQYLDLFKHVHLSLPTPPPPPALQPWSSCLYKVPLGHVQTPSTWAAHVEAHYT